MSRLQADFDFDDWASLAKTNPESFENRREEVIDCFIAGTSPDAQIRLRRMQWRIDTERRLSGHPMASCLRLFNEMWSSVYGECGLLESLQGLSGRHVERRKPSSAVILNFQDRRRNPAASQYSRPTSHS